MLIALMVLSAAGSAGDGNDRILFHPPLATPMVLTIADERRLPDMAVVRFEMRYHVEFQPAPGGVIVQVSVVDADCAGPQAQCAAYRAATASTVGRMRSVLIAPDGQMSSLSPMPSAATLTGSTPIARIIDDAGADTVAQLIVGEVGEAISLVGRSIGDATTRDGDALVFDTVSAPADDSTAGGSDTQSAARRGTAGDHATTVRHASLRVDRVTGLLTDGRTTISMTGDHGMIVSDRRWTLRPE